MLSVLFANMRAIGRFTLEKHHPKCCSPGFAFMFWPFEYPVHVLEFYLWNKLKYCLCISVFYRRNLLSSTTSHGVGSASASWILDNVKDVVNYCTIIDWDSWPGCCCCMCTCSAGGAEGLSPPSGVYGWNTQREARDGLDTGWSTRKWWKGSARYRAGAARWQPGCWCTISAAR